MPINYTIEESGNYVLVQAEGVSENLQEILEYIDAFIVQCEKCGIGNILLDHRKLRYGDNIALTYDLAIRCIDRLSTERPFKIALVVSPERMDFGRVYESIGINRGLDLKAFDRFKMAAVWLKP